MSDTTFRYNNQEYTYRKPDYSKFQPKPYYTTADEIPDETKLKIEEKESELKKFKHYKDLLRRVN